MTILAVIFDLDGTIAAFNLEHKTARAEVRGYLMKMGVPASVVAVNENIFDMIKKMELLMSNAGKAAGTVKEIREKALRIAEEYELKAAASTNLLPGAVDTLKKLREMKLKIGLCTINSEKSTEYILTRFKISEYFDSVVPRNQVTEYKPNPEHCNAALKAMGVAGAETAFVGDSVTDVQAAKEAKVVSIGLSTGVSTQQQLINEGANYVITSITDLPLLINRINKSESKNC